jgi:hypothetical protein
MHILSDGNIDNAIEVCKVLCLDNKWEALEGWKKKERKSLFDFQKNKFCTER